MASEIRLVVESQSGNVTYYWIEEHIITPKIEAFFEHIDNGTHSSLSDEVLLDMRNCHDGWGCGKVKGAIVTQMYTILRNS